jgi:RND family efflux transporter MFP subunit
VKNVLSLTGKTISYSSGTNTLYKLSQKATALSNAKVTSNYSSLESAYNTAYSAYNTANETYNQYKDSVSQAKSQLESASEQLENASTSDTLTELESQLTECSIKANQDGTITSLNATVGSAVSGAGGGSQQALATISNLDKLKVSITISESDINNAKIGMSCYITSDATDATLNGTLTQMDPVASDNGSFGAEVTVDDNNDGLTVGMNASVEIIVSSTEGVFSVPIDAVGDDDDNGKYVYRQTGGSGVDMTFEKIYVTTGEENDYYIEISADELAEGDVIRSSADLTEGVETTETDNSSGFNMFSMFGGGSGDMSSGQGGMGSGDMKNDKMGGNKSDSNSNFAGGGGGNAPDIGGR